MDAIDEPTVPMELPMLSKGDLGRLTCLGVRVGVGVGVGVRVRVRVKVGVRARVRVAAPPTRRWG